MGFVPQDQEIIQQLSKLKQADTEYPPELLAAQRHLFLKRMGEISLGVGAASNLSPEPKVVKAPPTTPIASTLLETVLVVAIIAEAGAVAYFYRDKLSDMVKTFVASGEVQEIISPPLVTTSTSVLTTAIITSSPEYTFTPEIEDSPTPLFLLASQAPADVVITPTTTPIPGIINEVNPVNPTAVQINSTPNPGGNNGNNGNHYGQTPKPERTKENNGNDNKPPKEDEKPPKEEPPKDDNKPPKDDPKPTKSK